MEVSRAVLDRIDDPDLVGSACLVDDSLVARERGQLERAIASASRARDILAANPDAPPDQLVDAMGALALAQSDSGQAAAANASYVALEATLRARDLTRTATGAVALNNWATHLASSGQDAAALAIAERAASLQRDLDPLRGAQQYTLRTMAFVLTSMGQWDRAGSLLDEAEKKARSHLDLMKVLTNRVRLYAESRDVEHLALAVTDLEQALRAAHLPPEDPWHASVLLGRGWQALLRGSPGEALEYLDRSIGLARASPQWDLVMNRGILRRAEALTALGRFAEAERDAREVVEWADGQLGGFAHSFKSAQAHRVLGQVMEARGDHEASLREWRKAYDHYLDTVGPTAPATRWVAARLGLPGPTAQTR